MTRLSVIAGLALAIAAAPVLAETPAQIEANKHAVLGFYQAALNDKDFDAAAKFLAPNYRQHNPTLPDGPEGIRKLTEILRTRAPNMHVDIKHIFAVDDFVIIHSHSIADPAKPGRATVRSQKIFLIGRKRHVPQTLAGEQVVSIQMSDSVGCSH